MRYLSKIDVKEKRFFRVRDLNSVLLGMVGACDGSDGSFSGHVSRFERSQRDTLNSNVFVISMYLYLLPLSYVF